MQYQSKQSPLGWSSVVAILALLTGACALGHDDIERETFSDLAASLPRASDVDATVAEEIPEPETEPEPEAPELGEVLGSFQFTYYWMARESKDTGEATTQLYTRKCKPLAKVSPSFASRLATEGTGMLRDGRVVNTSGGCSCASSCFFVVPRHSRWGVGVGKRPLSPFRTVAVDPRMIPIGSTLYIPEIDGLTMPGRKPWGGFVHDGCVVADDRGGGVQGNQLDFFTGRRHHYSALYRRHRLKSVTVFDGVGRCEKKGRRVVAVNRNSI